MTAPIEKIPELIATELDLIWTAHHAAGLSGYMCLYSPKDQVPFRSKEPGIQFWFGPEDTKAAIEHILAVYNNGHLPNTTLLLNPVVHEKREDGSYHPLGSGIIWSTSLSLGIDRLKEESAERVWALGVQASIFDRGEGEKAGLKILGFCDEPQPLAADGRGVIGCRELYEIADINSEQYASYYLLSGLSYLTNNGIFQHTDIATLYPKGATATKESRETLIRDGSITVQRVLDAAYCWNAYERHHSLYKKFGTNVDDVEVNLRFFNLVARDVELFDATGPMRKGADEMFEFLVPGLVPRGSITLLAATGGTGKSSLAHQLCVMAAMDYEPGEEAPKWLGQRLAIEKCKGISIYFSGEDGPPIINARASIFDPKARAKRLMFQRTDFGEGMTFAQHLRRLHKIPDVPIIVIDPARKYLSGDEDDAGVVSEFFEAIEEFAITKGASVVVVHHLRKGAYPKSAHEVLDMLRGSQVFVDRPRVVIGMFRDGPYTIAGLAKNNIPPNMGMVSEERVFARDPKHLGLIWLPGHQGIRNTDLSPEELEKLVEKAKEEGR
ncbi:MAG: AAA family ATPase [Rickettsiales bacterium]|nr:AAA family ATPase [Rickettsiales bacterium]